MTCVNRTMTAFTKRIIAVCPAKGLEVVKVAPLSSDSCGGHCAGDVIWRQCRICSHHHHLHPHAAA